MQSKENNKKYCSEHNSRNANAFNELYEQAQREFEYHPLWQDLGFTPREFAQKYYFELSQHSLSEQEAIQNRVRTLTQNLVTQNLNQNLKFKANNLILDFPRI